MHTSDDILLAHQFIAAHSIFTEAVSIAHSFRTPAVPGDLPLSKDALQLTELHLHGILLKLGRRSLFHHTLIRASQHHSTYSTQLLDGLISISRIAAGSNSRTVGLRRTLKSIQDRIQKLNQAIDAAEHTMAALHRLSETVLRTARISASPIEATEHPPPTAGRIARILHISDLHLGAPNQESLWKSFKHTFLSDVAYLFTPPEPQCDLVCFTGDIAYSGHANEFTAATDEITELLDRLEEISGHRPPFYSVPGNHDVLHTTDSSLSTRALDLHTSESFKATFWDSPTDAIRRAVNDAFNNYLSWATTNTACTITDTAVMPGDFATSIRTTGGLQIGLIGLNTSSVHIGRGNAKGRLIIHHKQLSTLCHNNDWVKWTRTNDINVLLTHHGRDWISISDYDLFHEEIFGYGEIPLHLFGHMHEGRLHSERTETGSHVYVQSPSLFGRKTIPDGTQRIHGYSVIDIQQSSDKDHRFSYRVWPRILVLNRKAIVPNHCWYPIERGSDCTTWFAIDPRRQ